MAQGSPVGGWLRVAAAAVLGCGAAAFGCGPVVLAAQSGVAAAQSGADAQSGAGAQPGAQTAVAAASVPEPSGFWTGAINSPVPRTIAGGKVIHARALASLLKGGSVVVVDVSNAPHRPENLPPSSTWLPVPHPAIKGAIWVPGAGLGNPPQGSEDLYRASLARATGNNLDQTLVIYCHEKCWLSWNGAKRAIQYGYRNVYWFPDGIEGWRKAGLPTEVVEPQGKP